MSSADWKAVIPVTADLVAKMVGDYFPEFRPATARHFGAGWDFNVFEVNGDSLFRLPKHVAGAVRLRRELAELGELSRALPISVPNYRWMAQGGKHYPETFAGYPKLPGNIAAHVDPEDVDQDAIARQIGDFLSVLHTTPVVRPGKPKLPKGNSLREGATAEEKAEGLKFAATIRKMVDDDLYSRLLEFLWRDERFDVPDAPECFCHGDLDSDHILVAEDGNSISGIIDWGDMMVAHPITDFSGWYGWLGEDFCHKLLEHYEGPLDESAIPRMKATAVWLGLDALIQSIYSNVENDRARGLRALKQGLASTTDR